MRRGQLLQCWLLLLLGVLPVLAQADEQMGRLFFTPVERAALDRLRQTSKPPEKNLRPEVSGATEIEAVPVPVNPSAVTVQGYVKRSDGKGTVWVNRQPVREKSSLGEIEVGRIGAGNRVGVKVPGGRAVELKAGQTYDPASGRIVEHPRDVPEAPPVMPAPSAEVNGKPAQPVPSGAANKP